MTTTTKLDDVLATAVLGIDTLWGGDVTQPSGTGRFIADSWFSDMPLPAAYTDATAAALRASGGAGAKQPDVAAINAYLAAVPVRESLQAAASEVTSIAGLRGSYLRNLVPSLQVMFELALEKAGLGAPVPFERCSRAAMGEPCVSVDPAPRRERVGALLAKIGYPADTEAGLQDAADAWRKARMVPNASIAMLADAFIAELDALTAANVVPHMPAELRDVPRANIRFLPIKDAWFSGSMNYLGRARTAAGKPEYEATYEINASLQISVPEFVQLVSHEVVPGHVTTFAWLQDLFVRGVVGFAASVPTMCTAAAALSEGIANNGILMAYGVKEVEELPGDDLQIGVLLALLQDDAKNQSAWLTWGQGWAQEDVAAVLRKDFLQSAERADKLSGAWGRHPLMGRMYLPLYASARRRWRLCAARTRRRRCCPHSSRATASWTSSTSTRPWRRSRLSCFREGVECPRGGGPWRSSLSCSPRPSRAMPRSSPR